MEDLFGKPVVSSITGAQGEFPFPLPSPLDLETQREANRWRSARCRETAPMFEDEDPHGPDNPCDDRGCDICNPPLTEECKP
jgi:hypothetical protein